MRTPRGFLFLWLLALQAAVRLVAASVFTEAPELHERVAAGALPPIEQRLPTVPVVVTPVEKPGEYGGTWRMVLVGYSNNTILIRTLAYEPLVRWDANWTRVVPNVASHWTVNAEATVFRFHLRPGMRWSDGEPFTARDIVAWMDDVVRDQDLTPIPPPWLAVDGRLPECSAPDAATVEFRFPAPKVMFLEQLASIRANELTRYPAHYFRRMHRQHRPAEAAALVARLGQRSWPEAFRIVYAPWSSSTPGVPTLDAWMLTNAYTPGVGSVEAVRNPYYWKVDTRGRQLPYLDRVQFDVVPDNGEALRRALAGQIDYERLDFSTVNATAAGEIGAAVKAGRLRAVRVIPSRANPIAICLNLAHHDPAMRAVLGNKEVRIALSEAIDRPRLIRQLYPEGGRPWQLAPQPLSPFHNRRLGEQYTAYAPERAQRRLEAAGLRIDVADGLRHLADGRTLHLNLLVLAPPSSPNWSAMLDQVSRDWRAIGVVMNWTVLPANEFYPLIRANRHDGAVLRGAGGYAPILEPEFFVPVSFENIDQIYYAVPWARWFINPTAPGAERPPESVVQHMELFRRVLAEPVAGRRATLMSEVIERAADEFYVMGICLEPDRVAIRTPGFRNVPASHIDSWTYPDPGPFNPCQFFQETPDARSP